MFFMDILKSSMPYLIKNYFYTFVTNQFRYQMAKFKSVEPKL